MSDTEPDSADDERSLFAKILRRSADELEEQPDDGGDPDVEQREGDEPDDDDEMDEAEQAADPIDTALEEGAIEAAQASRLRDVAERMEEAGVQTLVDAISENDLDVEDAVDMIEAYNGEEESEEPAGMADTEDDENEPEELRAEEEDDELDEDAVAELRSRLDAVAELGDRLDDIESRLDDLADSAVDEDALEQRLTAVGESLDEEFEDLIQRADVTGTPHPKAGETDGEGTLADAFGMSGD